MHYENPEDPISFPLGVGLLSSILKKKGHQVKGIYIHSNLDNFRELNRIYFRVKKFSPNLICYSCTSPAFEHIKKVAQHLRKYFEITGICGGTHPTLYPENTLSVEGIDYVCVGQGEKALIEFVENLENGRDCSEVPGVWRLHPEKGIIKNKLYPLIQELDKLHWIDYEVFGKSFIKKITKEGWLRYITSRGCPYSCTYCHNKMIREVFSKEIGVPVNKLGYVRFRSVDSVIEEILCMVQKYDLKVINFMDDLFCLRRDRTIEFCQKFKGRIPTYVGYSIQTHLQHLDKDLIEALRDSRCLRVVVGVESASQRILNLLKRKTNSNRISEKLSLLVNAKFPLGTWTLNMLGIPTETKEEMLETLALNAECAVERAKFNFLAPYPNSEIFDFCKKNNLLETSARSQRFRDRYWTNIKFPSEEEAFLEKFFDIGHWYMNLFLPSNVGDYYRPLIKEVEKMGPGEWNKARLKYKEIDMELSKKLSHERKQHYNFIYQGKVSGRVIGLTLAN